MLVASLLVASLPGGEMTSYHPAVLLLSYLPMVAPISGSKVSSVNLSNKL